MIKRKRKRGNWRRKKRNMNSQKGNYQQQQPQQQQLPQQQQQQQEENQLKLTNRTIMTMAAMIPPTVFQLKMATMTLKANFIKRRRRELWRNERERVGGGGEGGGGRRSGMMELNGNMPNEKGNVENCITSKKAIKTSQQDEEEDVEEETMKVVERTVAIGGRSVCLLCRREVLYDNCCWHCNKNHQEQQNDEAAPSNDDGEGGVSDDDDDDDEERKYNAAKRRNMRRGGLASDIKSSWRRQKYLQQQQQQQQQHHHHYTERQQQQQRYHQQSPTFLQCENSCQHSSIDRSLILCCHRNSALSDYKEATTTTTIDTMLSKNWLKSSTTLAFDGEEAITLATATTSPTRSPISSTIAKITAPEQQQHQQQVHLNLNNFEKTGTNDKIINQKIQAKSTTLNSTRKSANNNLEITYNNHNNNNTNHSDSKIVRIARSALRTFQIFIIFMHLQLLQCPTLFNNNNNNNKIDKSSPFSSNSLKSSKNKNNNSVHNNNNIKSNKRQQSPPKQRLNSHHQQPSHQHHQHQHQHHSQQRRSTSFENSSILNVNTSPKNSQFNVQMQQKEQQQQNHSQKHSYHQSPPHLRRQQYTIKMPKLSLIYKIFIILSFLSIFLPSLASAFASASAMSAHQQQLPQQLSLPTFRAGSSLSAIGAAAAALPEAAAASSSISSSLGLSSKIVPSSPASSRATSSLTSQVRLARNETVCKSMDLRNTPSEFRQLEKCTVIEGFLVMTLVNTHTNSEFTESYPLLTEVTDFIVVYRVHNLRSLSQIFPNLSVIRGGVLHEGYALVVYSNPHLEDLGLSKLTTISRGGVRIENNLWLCYVETIDWSLIVTNTTDIVIQNNRASIECPLCQDDPKAIRPDGATDGAAEGDAICKEYHGKRHCWNSKMCQKICPERCPNNCIDEKTCCNDACISGCSPDNLNVCTSCRHFSIYNSTCIDECPPNYYKFLDRRCVTAEACTRMGTKYENNKQETLVAFNGTCSTRCPNGYIKDGSKCVACGNKCTKKCEGGLIDSVSAAKGLHGCTHIIKEGLTISIKRGGRHLMEDLEFGLSSIQVIDTYLKVHLTFGMFSLEFFKSLRLIKGEALCEDKFALYVLENNDLETLWQPNQTVTIDNGRVFFHFNPKLCYSTIDALRASMRNDTKFDKNEVALDSNGYKGSCNPEYLNTTVVLTSATNARIKIVNPLKFDDDRTFIGYQYFYMEDRYKNATKHRHRPCDDSWFVSEPTKETDFIIPSLTPFTQYAYYIKTMTISSEPRNAQSPIQYFKTKSSQPNSVRKLEAYANSSSEIILTWLPPAHVYGNLSKYKVRAKLDLRNQKSATRNYCKDPVKGSPKFDTSSISKPSTEKPTETSDCNCYDNRDKDSTIYENEAAEANRHDVIDFENALQNFIYVKHPNSSSVKKEENPNSDDAAGSKKRQRRNSGSYDLIDGGGESFLIRHMRALPPQPPSTKNNAIDNKNISSSTTTTVKPGGTENSAQIRYDQTNFDEEGQYFRVVIDSVNASITKYVFKQLKHFSVYMLEVEACREPEVGAKDKECSEILSTYVRTLKMENVDKVENLQATLELNNTRPNVRLRWDAPERPNGAIVSYTIIYMVQAKDAVEEKKCITEQYYQNMTNGYLLTGLQMGSNYSIQIRANSLADEGVVSEAIYIQTPKPGMPIWLIIFLVIMLVLCLIGGAVGWHCYKTRKNIPATDLRFYPSVNPYYMSLQYEPDSWEVARERVIQLNPLGQGSFGMVYEGILKGLNSTTEDIPCAIKTVNENATDRERINFLNEAGVMKQFDTFHVVKLLGVCSQGQPALVVMELMKNGDLKSYLRAHRPYDRDDEIVSTTTTTTAATAAFRGGGGGAGGGGDNKNSSVQPPPLKRIYQMAIEIADGMAYLAAKKFVHRDLAARNCMVAADLTVKIGDFGMTRDIYETDYYRKGTKGLLPVRWMPPESLRDGVYSSASDVFSYGVVLWEMATLASQPYQGLSNDQVLRYVIDGGVMERPENCPDDLYDLMQRCWMHRPSARPTFMEIITSLLDHTTDKFADVSFYHSEAGQQALAKERAELQHSGDVFHDHDNDMDDDATTPLRMGEYNEYPLNADGNQSSVENHNDSPMVIDDATHSPYSIGSANIVSSTPDGGQSKNSFSTSQNQPILSSAPSTSATVIGSVGGSVGGQSHSYPRQMHGRYQLSSQQQQRPSINKEDNNAAYVQPDQWVIDEAATTQQARRLAGSEMSSTKDGTNVKAPPPTSRSAESAATDERGYEMFDPSPNFREHHHVAHTAYAADPADDDEEEDFDGIGMGGGRASKLSGGQNLLPRQKSRQRLPIIMPMSSSMPDEVMTAPMSSSAASSNASSNATATAGGGGSIGGGSIGGSGGGGGSSKYPTSLKRAVAETVQNVGNTLMPTRLRNINRRFFGHKRTGSNTSHKSTSSNPTSTNSNTNLTSAATVMGKNQAASGSGQSVESGSGSYTATPRFFTPTAAVGGGGDESSSTPPPIAIMSDNPNYTMLEETVAAADASAISSTALIGGGSGGDSTPAHKNNTAAKSTVSRQPTGGGGGLSGGGGGGFTTSTNPNYQLLDESLNTTAGGTPPPPMQPVFTSLSENPNYASHSPPRTNAAKTNTPYVMMNEPPTQAQAQQKPLAPKFSENPNYQMMGAPQQQQQQPPPPLITTTSATSTTTTTSEPIAQQPPTSAFSYLWQGGPSSSEDDPDDGDDDAHTEHIKMERMPLSRRAPQKHHQQQQQQQQQQQKKRGSSRSRSRSKSRTKSIERSQQQQQQQQTTTTATTTTIAPAITTTGGSTQAQTKPASQTFSLKEKWLRQQQQPPKPPPNGFIGREG